MKSIQQVTKLVASVSDVTVEEVSYPLVEKACLELVESEPELSLEDVYYDQTGNPCVYAIVGVSDVMFEIMRDLW